jgi:multiple sugar transport system permease protein
MAEKTRGILSAIDYRNPSNKFAYTVFLLVAVVLAVIMMYPIFWVFVSAMKESSEIVRMPPTFLPKTWRWENFKEAWASYQVPRMVANTAAVYAGFVLSRLLVITLAAYSLSRLRLPFRRGFYMLFLATLMLPAAAYLVPQYLVIQELPIIKVSLYDTWWALWLPAGASSMQLLLMKGFFDEIPRELSEAGRIDGASELRILGRLILPNSKPIIAVVSIFAFMEVWNNFFWQRLILPTQARWTMAVMLWYRSFTIGGNPPMNVQLAGMTLSIIPPLVLFMIFQKYITQGVTMTGLKG